MSSSNFKPNKEKYINLELLKNCITNLKNLTLTKPLIFKVKYFYLHSVKSYEHFIYQF